MLVEWLYKTTLEVSLLIGLVLLIRPVVRRMLGARVACWLWCLPMIRAVMIDRPERPRIVIESLGPGTGNLDVFPSPESWTVPAGMPWEAIWIGGAALWIALKLIAWIRFRAALDASSAPLEMAGPIPACAPRGLFARRASFVASDLPGTPFVTGLINPRICLPHDFAERYRPEEQGWMIRHELMHVTRHDLWMQLAWESLRAAFWFNPLVHIGARAMRDDQELACDQAILGECDAEARYSYGKTLIESAGAGWHPIALPFFGKHKERIAMLARHRSSRLRNVIGLALCAALGACALTSPAPEIARESDEKRITINFAYIELRAILQLLAEFSDSNIVVSDQVRNVDVTMRVENAPWDEVLEELVHCVGAEASRNGNVIVIRPAASPANPNECGDIRVSGQPI